MEILAFLGIIIFAVSPLILFALLEAQKERKADEVIKTKLRKIRNRAYNRSN